MTLRQRQISRGAARAAGAIALVALSGVTARAQQWHVETQAGKISAVSDLTQASAATVLVGARFDHPLGGARISTGVPTGAASPSWAALGGWRRIAARPGGGLVLDVDASGNGFLLRDRSERSLAGSSPSGSDASPAAGYAVAAQLLPGVGFESPTLHIHGRSGPSLYRSRLSTETRDRRVWVTEVEAIVRPAISLALIPSLRHIDDGARGYAYGGITAMASRGMARAWTSVGTWMNVEDAGTPWAVGGTLALHPRVALNASTRHEPLDPLYGRAPLRSWNVGLSVRFAGRGPYRPPVPASYANGRATIRLAASQSGPRPRIAGDFTGWSPRAMERVADYWLFEVNLQPGVYQYAFVADDDRWFVPEQTAGRRDDGFGGHVALLVVAP